jgi:PAS domain S-box-containing protein
MHAGPSHIDPHRIARSLERLPVALDGVPPAQIPGKDESVGATEPLFPQEPATVLLVDDHPAERLALRAVLEPLQIEMIEASSGEEALRLVESHALAAVLLDVQMPGQDGYQTARRIRETADRRLPILFLTAYESEQFPVIEAYRLGAVDYLVKPLIPEILRAKVAGFVEQFRHAERMRRQAKLLEDAERMERTRLAAALRESEERHRVWVQAVKDFAIFLMDTEGRITSWNEGGERLTGYRMEEVVGKNFAILFTQQDREAGKPEHELQVARATGSANDENWIARKDGGRFWATGYSTALKNEDGSERGFVKIIRDLTQRKQFEEALKRHASELAEAARRRDEFLAMLSHELRNPLAPIRNAVSVLEVRGGDAKIGKWAQEVIERQVRHMTKLIDDLLDVTRLARGKTKIEWIRLDLARLVASTIEDYRALIREAGLELECVVPHDPVWVMGDSTRISQVLGNLLDNARKFSDPGGEIQVRLASDRQNAKGEIIVQDRGIGMPEDLLHRVFDLFEQGQRDLARTRGGLGVGLALVKAFVEMHGGEVRAYSAGVGKGTKITVVLPLAQPSAEPAPPPPVDVSQRSLSIVLIEDNVDAGDTTKVLLESRGHRVTIARSGNEGIDLVRQVVPDVVVCDIGLPETDGYSVAQAIRREHPASNVRLIALSGYGTDADRELSKRAGFDIHLTKPVDPKDLIIALEPMA